MKAHAENTLGWLLRRGESVEIVPIQIVENPTDISEVVRCKDCKYGLYAGLGKFMCDVHDFVGKANFYCATGERKSDG